MNSTIIPSPDTIPVHWIWFQVLLTFTFVLHLLLMDLVAGGSLLAIWDLIKGKQTSTETRQLPILIALTINLGVPPLLFVQVLFGQFFYTSSVLMAVYWILVIPILILAYYGACIFSRKISSNLAKVSLIVSTLLIMYVAFMFVNNSTFALQPEKWGKYLTHPGGTLLNLSDASLWPRFLHFMVAAVAIASLGKAVWAKYFSKEANKEVKKSAIKRNLKTFGWATVVQFVIGIWFWLSMPSAVMKTFMGNNLIATLLMVIVILSALMIVFFALKGKLISALIQGVFQVVLMSIVREITRSTYLTGIFSPAQLENVHQTSPFVVFLLIFIIGLSLLYFMYQLAVKPKSNES